MNENSTGPDASSMPLSDQPQGEHDLWRPPSEHEVAAEGQSSLGAAVKDPVDTVWRPDSNPEKNTTPAEQREKPYKNFGSGEDGIDDPEDDASFQEAIDAALRLIGAPATEEEDAAADTAAAALDTASLSSVESTLELEKNNEATAADTSATVDPDVPSVDDEAESDPLDSVITHIAEQLREEREGRVDEEVKRIRDIYIQAILGDDHRETYYTAGERLAGMEWWGAHARREAYRDRDSMDKALDAVGVHHSELLDPKVPFNRAVARVLAVMGNDIHGTSDNITYAKPSDVTGMNPYFYYHEGAGDLVAALDRGEINTPETVATSEKMFKALMHYGLYKYHKWEAGSVLTTTLGWMERFTRDLPDFSPERAGLEEVYSALFTDLAVIRLDLRHHPNQHNLSDKIHLRQGTATALRAADRVVALRAIREQLVAMSTNNAEE